MEPVWNPYKKKNSMKPIKNLWPGSVWNLYGTLKYKKITNPDLEEYGNCMEPL